MESVVPCIKVHLLLLISRPTLLKDLNIFLGVYRHVFTGEENVLNKGRYLQDTRVRPYTVQNAVITSTRNMKLLSL